MRWLLLVAALLLPACQEQTAVATTGDNEAEEQLSGPYEDCLCNEVHALNEKVDKLLELLDKADWLPPPGGGR